MSECANIGFSINIAGSLSLKCTPCSNLRKRAEEPFKTFEKEGVSDDRLDERAGEGEPLKGTVETDFFLTRLAKKQPARQRHDSKSAITDHIIACPAYVDVNKPCAKEFSACASGRGGEGGKEEEGGAPCTVSSDEEDARVLLIAEDSGVELIDRGIVMEYDTVLEKTNVDEADGSFDKEGERDKETDGSAVGETEGENESEVLESARLLSE